MVELLKELCCAIKGTYRIRKSGARATMRIEFSSGRGLEYLRLATEHDLYKTIGDIDVCTEFEILKVKVPIVFLGTVGFCCSGNPGCGLRV
jgi:hypothetical protein